MSFRGRLDRHVLAQLALGLALSFAIANHTARADELDDARAASLDGNTALEDARRVHAAVETNSREIARMLAAARAWSDEERVECLDTRLAETNAVLRVAEMRFSELRRAVSSNDEGNIARLARIVRVLSDRAEALRLAAWRCPGMRTTESEGDVRIEVIPPGSAPRRRAPR